MSLELPVCKRCCFCLPLRYGLIVWGYFKMFIIVMVSAVVITDWIHIIFYTGFVTRAFIVGCIALFLLIFDIVLTITFIVGCHKKNVRVLMIYYYYSQLLLLLITTLSIYNTVLMICQMLEYDLDTDVWLYKLGFFSIYFIDIVTQAYIILLLRSEIMKLTNGYQFRFVNIAAEAECTLTMARPEIEKEDKIIF